MKVWVLFDLLWFELWVYDIFQICLKLAGFLVVFDEEDEEHMKFFWVCGKKRGKFAFNLFFNYFI